ncbi:hypothetical protein Droror1_Dr00021310 [Drosera rotundifolia]
MAGIETAAGAILGIESMGETRPGERIRRFEIRPTMESGVLEMGLGRIGVLSSVGKRRHIEEKIEEEEDLVMMHLRGSYAGSRIAILVMIERYAAASYPRKAIKTFELIENIRASPDHNAFYTLLITLCQNGNVEEAEEFMLNNKKLFPLDTDWFNIILYGWSSVMDVEHEAKRVWRDMARCCITPNADSYKLMISCLSRARRLFDSLKLYDEMKRKG